MPLCSRMARTGRAPHLTTALLIFALLVVVAAALACPVAYAGVDGELRRWHRVDLSFDGPSHGETDDDPNPFLDYRLQCLLTGPSGQAYDVAGFFDSDGAGGPAGSVWRCRFAPDEPGLWDYQASFRQGVDVAVSLAADAGVATGFDGESGTFFVSSSDKVAPDFRAPSRGLLVPGDHYLRFAGSGNPWVKGGPNVPENFLGYSGFDGTPGAGHDFAAHMGDWRAGDPDWGGGAGRAIIGALNYVAETGGNSLYFLPMNVGGDGDDTFPTVAEHDRVHFDTSKLAQWEAVFTHADRLGVFLHLVLSEAEQANANYHDGGSLGVQRKLFYRELVARFGHHLGVEWDIGEENTYGTARREQFAARLRALDCYDHPVTTHTRYGELERFYAPLLGNPDFTMTAIQDGAADLGDKVVEWRTRSAAAGVPWVVSVDEPHPIRNSATDQSSGYPSGRRNFMWPVYLSGGGGFEWYVKEAAGGDGFDQRIDDFGEMEVALRWTGHALEFLAGLPLLAMAPAPALGNASYVLAAPGLAYAMYTPDGAALSIDLSAASGTFGVRWFDPQAGQWHDAPDLQGGGWRSLGAAPFPGDAAVVVKSTDVVATTTTTLLVSSSTTTTVAAPVTTVTTSSTSTTSSTTTTLPVGACAPQPLPSGCRYPARARLVLRDRGGKRDQLSWKWLRGWNTAAADLGDPASDTTYDLCLYDWSGGTASLVADLRLPPGTRWRASGNDGLRYADPQGAVDGVHRLKIATGEPARARVTLAAGGTWLPMPAPAAALRMFEQDPRVTVQLVNGGGFCWTTEFEAVGTRQNRAALFRAKLP